MRPPAAGRTQNATPQTNGGVQFGPVGRWWDDRSVIRTVGISSDQKRKLDSVFDSNKPAILAAYKNFLNEQSKLAAVSKDPNADQAKVFAAIDAVNQARAALQKTTAQMYIELKRQMSAEQIEQVEKLK